MQRFSRYLINYGGSILYIATIICAVVFTVLGWKGKIASEDIQNCILFVLALVASLLLISHKLSISLQETMDDLEMGTPIGSLVKDRGDFAKNMKDAMDKASTVDVLCRTGKGFLGDYRIRYFEPALKRGCKFRFVLLDPRGLAVKILEKNRDMNDKSHIKSNIDSTTGRFKMYQSEYKDGLEYRCIDYLSAWSIFLFDPYQKNGVIYVELASKEADKDCRSTFKLEARKDKDLFERFRSEFEKIWVESQDATSDLA